MTYTPSTPQALDLPSDSQDEFLENFQKIQSAYRENHTALSSTVQHATRQNPTVITSRKHGLLPLGLSSITLTNMRGLKPDGTQIPWGNKNIDGDDPVNGNTYVITYIDPDTFTIPVNASQFTEYVDDSGAYIANTKQYGTHKRIVFTSPQKGTPTLTPPDSSLYTKLIKKVSQLFFSNDVTTSSEVILTNLLKSSYFGSNENGSFLQTPWGLIINFSAVRFRSGSSGNPITFPKAFTTDPPYTIIAQIVGKRTDMVWVHDVTNTGFRGSLGDIAGGNETSTTYYIAIGK